MSGGHDHVGAGLVGVLLRNPSRIEKVLVNKRHQAFKKHTSSTSPEGAAVRAGGTLLFR